MTQKLALETVPSMEFKCAWDMSHPLLRKIGCSRSSFAPDSRLPGCPPPLPLSLPRVWKASISLGQERKKGTKVTGKELFLNFHMILFIYIIIPRLHHSLTLNNIKKDLLHMMIPEGVPSGHLDYFKITITIYLDEFFTSQPFKECVWPYHWLCW